ncbi:hypothetical protein Tco_1182248 [Tanacetum coccineum]
MDQYIFQRRTPITQDSSTGPSSQPQDDTSANVVRDTLSPADAETSADTEKSNSVGDTEISNVAEEQGEDVSNMMALEERTVELDKGQAGLDPGKIPESRPPPECVLIEEDRAGSNPRKSHVVHAGPNPEPMYEDFISTVYPQVHESLKLTTEEHVYIENPPSSSRTLSSMKNLDDAFTFGDQFLNDKPTEEEPCKANMETKVESMVTIAIHQASSSAPPLSTPIIDLTPSKPVSPPAQEPIFIATTTTTTKTLPLPPPPPQQSTTVLEIATHVNALEKICANFEKKNKLQDKTTQALHPGDLSEFEMKEILHDQMFESGSYKSHPEHTTLYEALEPSMDRKNREESNEEMSKSQAPSSSSNKKSTSPSEQPIDDIPIPDDVHLSELEDTNVGHLPKIKTRPDWLKPVLEDDTPETPKPDWYIGKSKLVKADLEGPAYKLVRPFHKNSISLQFQIEECHLLLTDQIDLVNPKGNWVVPDVSKPLPLGGLPGDKERRNSLSISKLKAAYYPDIRLKEFVPSLWIESECDYNISAAYGISHWWFKRKEFYITRHSAPSDRYTVQSHMSILSVVSLKIFSRYGYTYLREIVLRGADYKKYKISEVDFKNLDLNDFEDLYLLHLQGRLNHLSGADKVHLFNAVNLWIRNIVIRQRMEDLQLGIKSYQIKLNLTQPICVGIKSLLNAASIIVALIDVNAAQSKLVLLENFNENYS